MSINIYLIIYLLESTAFLAYSTHGLDEVMARELVEFKEGTIGLALYLKSNNVGIVLMGDGLMIQEGGSVKARGRIAQHQLAKLIWVML